MVNATGRRYPKAGAAGIYLSHWANVAELNELDELGRYWGLDRSKTIKRAVAEANVQARKFKQGPRVDPKFKGKHVRKRGT